MAEFAVQGPDFVAHLLFAVTVEFNHQDKLRETADQLQAVRDQGNQQMNEATNA